MLENATLRIDPEFFKKAAVRAFRRLENDLRLGDFVNEGYRVVYENTKVIDRAEGDEQKLPYFLQSADLETPFINEGTLVCVPEADWSRYPKGRVKEGELLIEVKGKAEKVAVVPPNFPPRTLVTGTCFKLTTKEPWQRSLLVAHLVGKHGGILKDRLKTNLLVAYIAKNDLYRIPVPNFGKTLNLRIHEIVEASLLMRAEIIAHQSEADATLLAALGLDNWKPSEPLSYVVTAKNAFVAKRLDAQFFVPRIQALLDVLKRDDRTLATVAKPRRAKFNAAKRDTFNYIEIGDMNGAGEVGSTQLACLDAPSRATWFVKPNDIITSTVRPIRRLSAQIAPEQDSFVCSSGFVVIDPHSISPELLLTFLRLPVICELLDLYASASMYPAISEADIFGLPIPFIDKEVEDKVVAKVKSARAAKAKATQLLDAARHAVEIAIDESELAALAYLGQLGEVA